MTVLTVKIYLNVSIDYLVYFMIKCYLYIKSMNLDSQKHKIPYGNCYISVMSFHIILSFLFYSIYSDTYNIFFLFLLYLILDKKKPHYFKLPFSTVSYLHTRLNLIL